MIYNNSNIISSDQENENNLNNYKTIYDLSNKLTENQNPNNDLFKETIKTLSETLLISERVLTKKALDTEGQLTNYTTRKWLKYHPTLVIAKHYYKEISSHYFPFNGMLYPCNINEKTEFPQITEQTLMKIVRKATQIFFPENRHQTVSISLKNKTFQVIAQHIDNQLFLTKWSGAIEASDLSLDFLEKGAFSVVQKAFDLTNAEVKILKIAVPQDEENNEVAKSHLLKEVEKLKQIQEHETLDTLPPPPKSVFKLFYKEKNRAVYAYLQNYYNRGDIITCVERNFFKHFTALKILQIAESLFECLNYLHHPKKGGGTLIHGDLKPDNILVHATLKQNCRVAIHDFGGSKFASEFTIPALSLSDILQTPYQTTCTSGYSTATDHQKIQGTLLTPSRKKYVQYQMKRDIFALAATIWVVVTTGHPYEIKEKFSDTSKLYSKFFFEQRVGKKMTKLFIKALHEDPDKRPSTEKILSKIKAEIRKLEKS